jgi:hypothetical protein
VPAATSQPTTCEMHALRTRLTCGQQRQHNVVGQSVKTVREVYAGQSDSDSHSHRSQHQANEADVSAQTCNISHGARYHTQRRTYVVALRTRQPEPERSGAIHERFSV